MEHVISEECLDSIRRECVEAGRLGREAFTVRGPDGPRVTRCFRCVHAFTDCPDRDIVRCWKFVSKDTGLPGVTGKDGFCAWGEPGGGEE